MAVSVFDWLTHGFPERNGISIEDIQLLANVRAILPNVICF